MSRHDIDKLTNLRNWAVVGASNNQEKYGFKIFDALVRAGYNVHPINPRDAEVAGIKAYSSVRDLPEVPDVVDVVVPPSAGVGVVQDCVAKGVKAIWFQPGAESTEAIDLAKSNGLTVISDGPCAMVEARSWV